MSDVGRPWRVFLSHTGDLSRWPSDRSWAQAAEDAVKRLRHAPIDMAYFSADARPPTELCAALVSGCDLYVGIVGARCGSPVSDDPARSYTELEFDTATEIGKRRLVFLLDQAAVAAAPGAAADPYADRQEIFRARLLRSGTTVAHVSSPTRLETALVQAMAQLMLLDAIEARGPAPSAAAVSRRAPRDLPPEASAFVDRARDFELLSTHLTTATANRAAIGIVSGQAGVGKTSFAVHVGHRVRDHFPDGQLYVDLRGYSPLPMLTPEQALDGFLRALGVQPSDIPADLQGLARAYRAVLDRRRALIVLDNALTSAQIRPLLPPAGSAAIITTRGPLSGLVVQDGALRLPLEPLPPIDAEALVRVLISGQVEAARPSADAATTTAEPDAAQREDPVTLLARQCGYLPLALRIAVEHAAVAGLGLADLVDELASEHGRLDALTGIDDDPGAQVRTVFSWSYRNLTDSQRRAFRLIAAHPGSDVSVDASAALLGLPPGAATRLLDSLVAYNMLQRPVRGRYQFHDLVGAYAAERLDHDEPVAEREAALDRELDWYLCTADATDRLLAPLRRRVPLDPRPADVPVTQFASPAEALRWNDREAPTIPALVRLAASSGRPGKAWKLALVWVTYCQLRHRDGDWLEVVEIGGAAATATGDVLAQAWCSTSVGGACMALGLHERAYAAHEASLRLHRQIGDRLGESMALSNLGEAALVLGRLDEALAYGNEALALSRQLGNARHIAFTLHDTIAPVHLARGEHTAAIASYTQAAEISRGVDQQAEAVVLHGLGTAHLASGNRTRPRPPSIRRRGHGARSATCSGKPTASDNWRTPVARSGTPSVPRARSSRRWRSSSSMPVNSPRLRYGRPLQPSG